MEDKLGYSKYLAPAHTHCSVSNKHFSTDLLSFFSYLLENRLSLLVYRFIFGMINSAQTITSGFLTRKIRNLLDDVKGQFPFLRDRGSLKWLTTPHCDWCGGQWIGMLLRAYSLNGDSQLLTAAEDYLELADDRWSDRDEFLGFIFSYGRGLHYQLFRDAESKSKCIAAADLVARMYNSKIGLIPLGEGCRVLGTNVCGEDKAAVDGAAIGNSILFTAYDLTGNHGYLELADKNLKNSLKLFMRPDGSTVHMVEFDPETGSVKRKYNNLGYDDDSTWSRGQAWIILALSDAVTHGLSQYEDSAWRAFRFFWDNTCKEDRTPPYDFHYAKSRDVVPSDTSALSITLYAMLNLGLNKASSKTMSLASEMLQSLLRHVDTDPDSNQMLLNGCFDYPRSLGTDADLIWGDYYFFESYLRMMKA
jgi:unsaturated chondroitin disaccharide hydrolase